MDPQTQAGVLPRLLCWLFGPSWKTGLAGAIASAGTVSTFLLVILQPFSSRAKWVPIATTIIAGIGHFANGRFAKDEKADVCTPTTKP